MAQKSKEGKDTGRIEKQEKNNQSKQMNLPKIYTFR